MANSYVEWSVRFVQWSCEEKYIFFGAGELTKPSWAVDSMIELSTYICWISSLLDPASCKQFSNKSREHPKRSCIEGVDGKRIKKIPVPRVSHRSILPVDVAYTLSILSSVDVHDLDAGIRCPRHKRSPGKLSSSIDTIPTSNDYGTNRSDDNERATSHKGERTRSKMHGKTAQKVASTFA